MRKKNFFLLLVTLCLCIFAQAQMLSVYELSSPNGQLVLTVENGRVLQYSLSLEGRSVIHPSAICMTMQNGNIWGKNGEVVGTSTSSTSEKVYPVAGNYRELTDHYNELSLKFKDGYSVIFRMYNEGMAYRFCGNLPEQDSLIVVDEEASFNLADDPAVILPETTNFTAWELSNVLYEGISKIEEHKYGITPTLFTNKVQNVRVVVAESDLNNYPGMYLRKEDGKMKGYWATYPKTIEMGSWGNFITVVKERENYLARTAGNHAFPWRMAIVAKDDKELLTNEMIYLLAKPQQIKDTDWIRPGKATWEWWHCAILEKAPFPSGHQNLSTQMYKYYIDFASENKIPYLLVDAGWSNVFNHADLNKNIDIKEVIRYGKEKKVGVWLWTVAATLFQHPHCYLDSISKWGAVGVKIDFFDRDDAQIIPQYENLARLVLSGILWWIFMDAASLPDFIGHILISFLMKPYDVRSVLSGIPLLIRIISFNVSLPVCWEVELIILRGRCVTAHWKNLSRSIRGCLVHWGLVHMNWPCLLYFPHHLPVYVILRMSIVSILIF